MAELFADDDFEESTIIDTKQEIEEAKKKAISSLDNCVDCKGLFLKCDLCEGYFFKETLNEHNTICKYLQDTYKAYQDSIPCVDCGELVFYDKYITHKTICLSSESKEMSECSICNQQMPNFLLEEHEEECDKLHKQKSDLVQFRCELCGMSIDHFSFNKHLKQCELYRDKLERIRLSLLEVNVKFPSTWDNSEKRKEKYINKLISSATNHVFDDVTLIEMARGETEWNEISNRIKMSNLCDKNIHNVLRVENKELYSRFYKNKIYKEREKGFKCETSYLFHGSRNLNPMIICNLGFDATFTSDLSSYGRGIYMHNKVDDACWNAYYNNNYNSYPVLMVIFAEVITGVSYYSLPNKINSPPLFNGNSRYDSVTDTDNLLMKQDINQTYILYENDVAYPSYIVFLDLDTRKAIKNSKFYYWPRIKYNNKRDNKKAKKLNTQKDCS